METLWDGMHHKILGFDDYFDFNRSPWECEFEIGPF